MSETLLLTRIRAPGIGATQVLIRGGHVARVGGALDTGFPDVPRLDGGDQLLLPALVDGHTHLDKTLTGLPWMPHRAGPDRMSRIETEKRLRVELPPVSERAGHLIERCIAHGTRAIRTHVDVTCELELTHLDALLALRKRFAGLVQIQIVAFPQSGVLCRPGTPELLDRAMASGADLVGGIDPITFDGDAASQLDRLFEIATRHDAGVDVHLHDAGERGLLEIRALSERCLRHQLHGRVTVSHGFALGAAPETEFRQVAFAMARAGVSLVTHGGGASPLPPVKRLRELGVEVFAGNDDVRDPWSPFGNGDMLERAMLLAWRAGFRTDSDLALALDCASHAGARALGLEPHGIEPGARADLVLVPSETVAEAVVSRPPRTLVLHGGHVVARDGELTDVPLAAPG